MRAYGIPDVDLLVSLYEHSTVRMAPNDPQSATITFDTGVAQGSALSPLLFLIFMNALLGLITDRGWKLHVSHGLKCGVQLRKKGTTQDTGQAEQVGQFNLNGFVDDLSLFTQTLGGAQALLRRSKSLSSGADSKSIGRKSVRWSLSGNERASVRRMKHWYTWGKRWLSWHPRWRVGTWGYGAHRQEICQPRKHESSRKRRKLGIYLGTTLSPLSRQLTS